MEEKKEEIFSKLTWENLINEFKAYRDSLDGTQTLSALEFYLQTRYPNGVLISSPVVTDNLQKFMQPPFQAKDSNTTEIKTISIKEAAYKEKQEYLLLIKSGNHPQFHLHNDQVECCCGCKAIWFKTGYLCGSITAYSCKFN